VFQAARSPLTERTSGLLAAWKDRLHYSSAASLQVIPHIDHIHSSLNDATNEPTDQGKDTCENGGTEPK